MYPFFPIQFGFFLPIFLPAHDTLQNSFLFYLHAHFSGRACRHHHLLVINYPLLVSTTRQNMPAAQTSLPFINVNVAPDMRKTSLPNLSYPIRPTHTPWVESSVPLVITVRYLHWLLTIVYHLFFRVQKTESLRYQTSFVYSNGSSGVSSSHIQSYFSRTYPPFSWSPPRMTPL